MEREADEFRGLREAVRLGVARSSVTAVARDAGVCRTTIYNLLAARVRPYVSTRARLDAWFRKRVAAGEFPGNPAAVRYLLEPLLLALPADERQSGAEELVEALREIYTRRSGRPPAWLAAAPAAPGDRG